MKKKLTHINLSSVKVAEIENLILYMMNMVGYEFIPIYSVLVDFEKIGKTLVMDEIERIAYLDGDEHEDSISFEQYVVRINLN